MPEKSQKSAKNAKKCKNFSKMRDFIVPVLLSVHAERVDVSRMRDFLHLWLFFRCILKSSTLKKICWTLSTIPMHCFSMFRLTLGFLKISLAYFTLIIFILLIQLQIIFINSKGMVMHFIYWFKALCTIYTWKNQYLAL